MSAETGFAGLAKGVLVLVVLFAVFGLVAQIIFGQVGTIAKQFPVDSTNPFYNAYSSLNTALTNAMTSLSPAFQLVAAVIIISIVFVLIRVIM
jgi:hypothetical protein